jgi:plasmid stabilization system protein ParE
MAYWVVYKPLAQVEVSEAFAWYAQPHIQMGDAFLAELEHTSGFLASTPHLYAKVEGDMRCAHLSRFPYSLFYVVDGDTVNVLSCFHQYRDPQSRSQLLG